MPADRAAPLVPALPAAAARVGAAAGAADERARGAAPRWGYRKIWRLLRDEGFAVNRKRVERLWRLEGHRVPPRRSQPSGKKAQGTAENAAWNRPATRPNDVWSYDFMSAITRDGRSLRILNVVDEHTRVAVGCRVARSIGAKDVIAELERVFARHGKPAVLRSDNGREFIAATLAECLAGQGVQTAFIEKGSPQQNPFVERFNGTMRDELLNGEEFGTLVEARVVIADWVDRYNSERPHRGLGMMTPLQYAADWNRRMREATGSNPPHPHRTRKSHLGGHGR